MAFLRSDSDDEGVKPAPPPPRPAAEQPPARQPAPGMSRFGFKLEMEGQQQGGSGGGAGGSSGGNAPPPPPPPPPPQQQQGEAAGGLVGKKLTFDQFKQAAAAATSGTGSPSHAGGAHLPAMPVPTGRMMTAAELEQGLGPSKAGAPSGGNRPAPPPNAQPPGAPAAGALPIGAVHLDSLLVWGCTGHWGALPAVHLPARVYCALSPQSLA
jgi:hypothetical protein